MEQLTKKVDSITLNLEQPTEMTFADLHTWVIWQFPRQTEKGLCGAVRPPVSDLGWFPALIRLKEKRVLIHGHLKQQFATPHEAADWITNKGKTG
jgi:hypothetical protein